LTEENWKNKLKQGLTSNTNILQELSINNCDIYDLQPLSCLYELKYLFLDDNRIEDISPISDLTELQILGLERNNICDIFYLSEMHNLKELYIYDNPISDISCIADIIIELDSLSVDVDYLELNEIDYRIKSEFKELISYVNYKRNKSGLKEIVLNDPYISYYLSEYGAYRKVDETKMYINTLSQQYGARAVFRHGLSLDYINEYEDIIEWIKGEHTDILDRLLYTDYGNSDIYVSMHYEDNVLVIEMAYEE